MTTTAYRTIIDAVGTVLAPTGADYMVTRAVTNAVLSALGIPGDSDLAPFHVIRADDGDSVDGEHAWLTVDGLDDWTAPENCYWDDPRTFTITRYYAVSTRSRTFPDNDPDPEEPDTGD